MTNQQVASSSLDNSLFKYKIENVDNDGNIHKLRLDFIPAVLEQSQEALIEALLNLAAMNPSESDGAQTLLRMLSQHLVEDLQSGRLSQDRLKEGLVLEFD